MFKARCVVWLGLTLGLARPVCAQDTDVPSFLGDPPRADDEWNSAYDGTWDPDWDSAFTQSSAPWQLNLAGGARQTDTQPSGSQAAGAPSNAQREYYALATLQLPLEQAVTRGSGSRARRSAPGHAQASTPVAATTHAPTSTDRPEPAPPAQQRTPTSLHAQAGATGDRPTADRRRVLLRQTLALTQQLLMHVTDTVSDRAALQSLASLTKRSRWSGLVPELRVRGVYGFDRTVSQQDSSGIYPTDLTTRGGHDSLIEGRLSFRLDRLVYGDQEGALNQRRRDIRLHEEKRKRDAVASLTAWMDARRRRAAPDLDSEQLLEALREEQEALLALHLMSDGWFEGELTLELLGLTELMEHAEILPEQDPEAARVIEPESATNAAPRAHDSESDQPAQPSDG